MFLFCNPCARAELHQQNRARKLCSATLNGGEKGVGDLPVVNILPSHIDQNFQNNNDIEKKTAFTFKMTWATCYLYQFKLC